MYMGHLFLSIYILLPITECFNRCRWSHCSIKALPATYWKWRWSWVSIVGVNEITNALKDERLLNRISFNEQSRLRVRIENPSTKLNRRLLSWHILCPRNGNAIAESSNETPELSNLIGWRYRPDIWLEYFHFRMFAHWEAFESTSLQKDQPMRVVLSLFDEWWYSTHITEAKPRFGNDAIEKHT